MSPLLLRIEILFSVVTISVGKTLEKLVSWDISSSSTANQKVLKIKQNTWKSAKCNKNLLKYFSSNVDTSLENKESTVVLYLK